MGSRCFGTGRSALAALAAAAALAATGCVETATYEKAATELTQARQASWQKDQQIRALEWHLSSIGQQVQANRAHEDAAQRELAAKLAEISAANASLLEQLKQKEAQSAALALALDEPKDAPGARKNGACAPMRPEDLRRLQASIDARNGKITESLTRVERLLHEQAEREGKGGPRPGRGPVSGDLVDPWGFGERK